MPRTQAAGHVNTRERFPQPLLTLSMLLVSVALTLVADVTATLSETSLEFTMLAAQSS